MQNVGVVNKSQQVYRLCTIVTMVLSISLCVASCWAIYRYSHHDNNDWDMTHNQLGPAYRHFDLNREAKAILAVRELTGSASTLKTAACTSQKSNTDFTQTGKVIAAGAADGLNVNLATDWEKVEKLTSWRGTNVGCLTGGKATAGACTNLNSGTAIAANPAVTMNRWRNEAGNIENMFCIVRTKGRTYRANAAKCPTGQALCGDHCYRVPTGWTATDCVLGEWKFGKEATTTAVGGVGKYTFPTGFTTGWSAFPDSWDSAPNKMQIYYKRLTTATTPQAESIGLRVSWYGNECINTNLSPADPSLQYPLMASTGTGCGTLKANPSSQMADQITQKEFMDDNSGLLINPTTNKAVVGNTVLPGYANTYTQNHENFKVQLNNIRRILVRSDKFCDAFRFNTNKNAETLLSMYDSIYNLVKWLAICTTSTAMISLMMVLLVQLAGNRTTQTFMTGLYAVCLIGLFLTVVLVWKARYQVIEKYTKEHAHFLKAASEKCIVNADWLNVLTQWNSHTDLSIIFNALKWFLWLFVALLLVGVIFAIWALMNLAESANTQRTVSRL